ncbi:MAG TPA: pyridoxal 5'-phosphate synthase glutaminase subunit PdxT [Desulfomonilaceae bacterium]|nr:pyridoxal 5'-phosphate synthase glutaminase subunit PdxT [Desulfomonilaceae bacterium]
MKIGVLALQGDFQEHCQVLKRIGVECREIRLPEDMSDIDGLIIPGGESTTVGKLATTFGLLEPLRDLSKSIPLWGTCAGLVFMARDVGHDQPILGIMDMVVQRNAFGRQVDSFEEDLDIKGIPDGPFHGVFIRAPIIQDVGPDVEVMCRVRDKRIVAARQGRLLVTAFHPELTEDDRLHRYFLSMAANTATKA